MYAIRDTPGFWTLVSVVAMVPAIADVAHIVVRLHVTRPGVHGSCWGPLVLNPWGSVCSARFWRRRGGEGPRSPFGQR